MDNLKTNTKMTPQIQKQTGDKKGTTDTLPRFQTIYNAHQFPKWAEEITGPSTTMPDMTLSLDEIVRRFARGIPITGQRFPIYDGDEDQDFPDLTFTDKLTREELKMTLNDELRVINERQQQRVRKQKKDAEDKAAQDDKDLKERINSYLKEKGADQGPIIQRTTGEGADQGK